MCVNNFSGQFIYSDLYKRCVQFCMIITPNIASFIFKVTKYILSRKISSHMIFFDQIFSRITFPHILAAPPAQKWEYPNLHFVHPSTITNSKSAVSLILVNFQLILVKLQGVQLLLWVVTCAVIAVHAVDRPGIAQFEMRNKGLEQRQTTSHQDCQVYFFFQGWMGALILDWEAQISAWKLIQLHHTPLHPSSHLG